MVGNVDRRASPGAGTKGAPLTSTVATTSMTDGAERAPPDGPGPSSPGTTLAPSLVAIYTRLSNLMVVLGTFALAYGAFGATSRPDLVASGAVLVSVGIILFVLEGRASRALIRPGGPSSPSRSGPPWWRKPAAFSGRWLCVTCGWRQAEKGTLCPRCGRVLVRLPPPTGRGPAAASPEGDPSEGAKKEGPQG